MNVSNLKHLATALAVTCALSACKAPSPAAESTPSAVAADAAPAPAPAPAPAEAMPASEAPMAIPETADAIWQAIDKHSAELKSTIDSGSLSEVHHHAFAIRDLVTALPTHSPKMSAEDETKLQGQVKFVSTLADRLDASGDSNDQAGSKANYDQLMTVLSSITRTK